METVTNFLFFGSKITGDLDCSYESKRFLLFGRRAVRNLDRILKSRDITLSKKVLDSQNYDFSSRHVWMWELDHKEGWTLMNWCFQIAGMKALESPLDCKEIQPVHPKGNQSWLFIGRTDAEAETPILWPPDVKVEKTLMLGKTESKKRRGWWRMRCLESITTSMDLNLSKLQQTEEGRGAWQAAVHGVAKSQTWASVTFTFPHPHFRSVMLAEANVVFPELYWKCLLSQFYFPINASCPISITSGSSKGSFLCHSRLPLPSSPSPALSLATFLCFGLSIHKK